MSKRERVLAALQGREVERPPFSFWGHDFLREWSAEGLAAAMVESVCAYDYDYLKVNPRAEQLEALRRIGEGLGGEVSFIQTVFSPLSVVSRMANDRELVRRWMAEAPEAL